MATQGQYPETLQELERRQRQRQQSAGGFSTLSAEQRNQAMAQGLAQLAQGMLARPAGQLVPLGAGYLGVQRNPWVANGMAAGAAGFTGSVGQALDERTQRQGLLDDEARRRGWRLEDLQKQMDMGNANELYRLQTMGPLQTRAKVDEAQALGGVNLGLRQQGRVQDWAQDQAEFPGLADQNAVREGFTGSADKQSHTRQVNAEGLAASEDRRRLADQAQKLAADNAAWSRRQAEKAQLDRLAAGGVYLPGQMDPGQAQLADLAAEDRDLERAGKETPATQKRELKRMAKAQRRAREEVLGAGYDLADGLTEDQERAIKQRTRELMAEGEEVPEGSGAGGLDEDAALDEFLGPAGGARRPARWSEGSAANGMP